MLRNTKHEGYATPEEIVKFCWGNNYGGVSRLVTKEELVDRKKFIELKKKYPDW